MKSWDVFISHASEDKDGIVRELAEKLERLGVRVWYDDFTLKLGDSLSRSIDEGLIHSKYGVVILSQNFLDKRWTDYEYRSLLSREENGDKLILPVWHRITKDEVKKFSPYLADKVAVDASKTPLNKIILRIVENVRPDIFQSIKACFIFKSALASAETKYVKPSDIKEPERPRSKLSKQQEIRAKNIYYGRFKITLADYF